MLYKANAWRNGAVVLYGYGRVFMHTAEAIEMQSGYLFSGSVLFLASLFVGIAR